MESGGRGRNRTYNLSVKSRMLCQLSYASNWLEYCAGEEKAQYKRAQNLPPLDEYNTAREFDILLFWNSVWIG